MTPREFGSFTLWMLLLTAATHSAYAQNNSQHGTAVEVTPFMSHDSTFRWRIGAGISYAWTSRLKSVLDRSAFGLKPMDSGLPEQAVVRSLVGPCEARNGWQGASI